MTISASFLSPFVVTGICANIIMLVWLLTMSWVYVYGSYMYKTSSAWLRSHMHTEHSENDGEEVKEAQAVWDRHGVRSQEAVPWRCYWVLPVQPPPPPLILFMFCQTEISTNKDDSWWQQHAAPLTSIICKKNKQHFTWRVSRCGIDAMEFTSSSQPDSNAGWKLTRIISLCSRSSQCCTPAGVPKPCFLLLLLWFYGYFFLHI